MKRCSLIVTILLFGLSGCVTQPPQLAEPPEAQPIKPNVKKVTAVQLNPKLKTAGQSPAAEKAKNIKPPKL